MTRYEPIQPDRVRVFWPMAGDEGMALEGIYEQLEPGKYQQVLVLRTATGIRKVSVTARVAAVLPQLKIGARYRFTYAGKTPLPGEWVAPRRPDVGAIPGETPEGGGCRYISIEIH